MVIYKWIAAEKIRAGQFACFGPDDRVYEKTDRGRATYVGRDGRVHPWTDSPAHPGPVLMAIRDIAEGEAVCINLETGEVGGEVGRNSFAFRLTCVIEGNPPPTTLPAELREGESWRDRPPLL